MNLVNRKRNIDEYEYRKPNKDAPPVKSKRIELSDYLFASNQMDLTVLLACRFGSISRMRKSPSFSAASNNQRITACRYLPDSKAARPDAVVLGAREKKVFARARMLLRFGK